MVEVTPVQSVGYPSGNSNRSAGSDPYESFFTDTRI